MAQRIDGVGDSYAVKRDFVAFHSGMSTNDDKPWLTDNVIEWIDDFQVGTFGQEAMNKRANVIRRQIDESDPIMLIWIYALIMCGVAYFFFVRKKRKRLIVRQALRVWRSTRWILYYGMLVLYVTCGCCIWHPCLREMDRCLGVRARWRRFWRRQEQASEAWEQRKQKRKRRADHKKQNKKAK